MIYSDLTAALENWTQTNPTDDFTAALPRITEQGELRCYREVDFMVTRTYSTTTITASSPPLFTGPSDWLIGRTLTLINGGIRTELFRRDETFLQVVWPNRTVPQIGNPPKYWAEVSAGTLLIAPPADGTYGLEMAYTSRPAPISANNPSTWLSVNCPDLLLYACLVAATGFQKNYGQQSADPGAAMSWETQFQAALRQVMREEARRKAEATFDIVTAPPSTNAPRGP